MELVERRDRLVLTVRRQPSDLSLLQPVVLVVPRQSQPLRVAAVTVVTDPLVGSPLARSRRPTFRPASVLVVVDPVVVQRPPTPEPVPPVRSTPSELAAVAVELRLLLVARAVEHS